MFRIRRKPLTACPAPGLECAIRSPTTNASRSQLNDPGKLFVADPATDAEAIVDAFLDPQPPR